MKNSYILLGSIFIFSVYWFFYLYKPFWSPMAVALLLAIATHSLNEKLVKIVKNRVLVATLLTFLLSILFFVPIMYSLVSLTELTTHFDSSAIKEAYDYASQRNFQFNNEFAFLNDYISNFINSLDFQSMGKKTIHFLTSITKASAGFFIDMLFILTFFFFANLYSIELINFSKKVAPIDETQANMIFFEITNVMSVVFYSILLTAIFEGTLFAILVIPLGYNGFLLGILYGFASLIPIIGGIIMWIPLVLYELLKGNITNAIIIASYSIIVISIIADTFIKPIIIKYINKKFLDTPTKINELIIFFSIVAGLSTFGFWGMIIGPAITTFFISILNLLKEVSIEESKLS